MSAQYDAMAGAAEAEAPIELLIIGGGAAGQAAALTAAEAGRAASTVLIDEGPIPPAWMQRQVPRWYGERLPAASHDATAVRQARYLARRPGLQQARAAGVDVRLSTACWGLFPAAAPTPHRVGVYDSAARTAELLNARQVILATGSIDVPLPFPGRTLPGVLGGLAALDLLQTDGSLGGERIVILGGGSLGLAVAQQVRAAGHTLVAIVDIDPQCFDAATSDAVDLLADLDAAGVDLVPGYTVAAARGGEMLEQVLLCGVDASGQRRAGETYPVRCDTLVVATGRQPSLELAYLRGCALHHDPTLGGSVPTTDPHQASSVPGLYIVGDAAGVSDASFADPDRAAAQGRAAARAALGVEQVDTAPPHASKPESDASASHAMPHGGHYSAWQQAAIALANDAAAGGASDLLICRCEGVTLGDLQQARGVVGARVPDELKRFTRAGMGECQGRNCRLIVAGLLAAWQQDAQEAGSADEQAERVQIPLASYRPPVRPVPLGVLGAVALPEAQEALLPAFASLAADLDADLAAGLLSPARHGAAQYKLQEESHHARMAALSDDEIAAITRALRETVRHVSVH